LINAVQKIIDDSPVLQGSIHGDFAPWNLKLTENNEIIAVDWEFSEVGTPIIFDLIHYMCRINSIKNDINISAKKFEEQIVNEINTIKFNQLTHSIEVYRKLFRCYLIWYQIVLAEHGILDSTLLHYQHLTRELLNDAF
jgi:thiamine kinase-like enzyme